MGIFFWVFSRALGKRKQKEALTESADLPQQYKPPKFTGNSENILR
ncbi:hypothetical protein B14911_02204 [Bacillus sp. NRRL B-14911]|nr:hypothetical protein B14911_02204 [Bacillus sp. NRRL B-14911]